MTIISDSILSESQTARNNLLGQITEEEAVKILNQVKTISFASWNDTLIASTGQIAYFFDIGYSRVVRYILRTYRDEFKSDGVQTLKAEAAEQARSAMSRSLERSAFSIVCTPLSAIRLAIFLRDNPIANRVIEVTLSFVQGESTEKSRQKQLELEIKLSLAKESAAVAQKQLIICCHKLAQLDPKLPELVFSHSELNPPKEKEEDSFPDNSFEATPYGRKGNNHNGFYVNNSLTPSF